MQRITTAALFAMLILSGHLSGNSQERRRKHGNEDPKVTSRFISGESALRVPLELDNNIIFLRVRVNGSRPLKFIFDTGASVSVINSELLGELKLKPEGQAKGTATGGNIEVGLISGVSLSVEGAEVANQIVASISLEKMPCVEFDGVIGYDFINQFVVEIDYQNSLMNLYRPESYAYSGNGKPVPLLLAGRRTPLVLANVTGEDGRSIPSKLEFDTGGDGTFIVTTPWAKKNGLLKFFASGLRDTGVGAGGESKRVISRVRQVQLGPFTINNPILSVAQDEEGSHAGVENDGIIGGEIFRRFKVVLDYSRKQVILEPNSALNEPYEVGMSGIVFGNDAESCKVQKIERVEPNSPAADAGLKAGDIVTAIDGRSMNDIPSNEFEQLFRQNGRELMITIKRSTDTLQKKIKLRRMI